LSGLGPFFEVTRASPYVGLRFTNPTRPCRLWVITNTNEWQAHIAILEDLTASGTPLDAIGLRGNFDRNTGEGYGKLPSDAILVAALQFYSALPAQLFHGI
jgi:hypothetical protein